MKKLFVLLLLPLISYSSEITGDNLGSHKAVRDIDLNSKNIDNAAHGEFTSQHTSGTVTVVGDINAEGYTIHADSVNVQEVITGTITSRSPLILRSERVDIAGGALNVQNGGTQNSNMYIRVNHSALALAISSGPHLTAPSKDPSVSDYSIAITSDGICYVKKIVWVDQTESTSANSGIHAGGGGGAYTAREYKWEAGQFSFPSFNSALLVKNEYGTSTSSRVVYSADFDTTVDEFVSVNIENFDDKYDGNAITWELTWMTDTADAGVTEWNIDTTTATNFTSTLWATNTFGNFDAGDGIAYGLTVSTLTQSTNLPVAGQPYGCKIWEDASDSSVAVDSKLVYAKIKYGVDAD